MPATVADIAAGTRPAAIATWQNAAIKARYPTARDGSTEAAIGYSDAIADAQAIADARGSLIGMERRRFVVAVAELLWIDPTLGVPTVRLVDAEQGVDGNFLIARFALDLENETTTLELYG